MVPIAVTGTEEAMPTLFSVPIGKQVQVPVTLNALLLGPLGGIIPLPVKIDAHILEPVRFDVPPDVETYSRRLVADWRGGGPGAGRRASSIGWLGRVAIGGRLMMRRVLVTGASTPLGRGVMARLADRVDVETVIGLDRHGGVLHSTGSSGRLMSVDAGRALSISDLVDANAVDTIVHVGMCPSRSGAPISDHADVISTLQVAAVASGRPGPVRTVVAVSSTEVYPASARAPTWRREDELLQPPGRECRRVLALEAEDLLRDVAQHQPHISVGILRLADLAGPRVLSGLSSLLAGAVVPLVPGYDPPVQFLHPYDAVRAIEHAANLELAGTFNVTGDGVVRWRRAARMTGRPTMPVLARFEPIGRALRAFKVPTVPTTLIDVLRFGRCADTSALAATGFSANHATEECIRAIAHGTTGLLMK